MSDDWQGWYQSGGQPTETEQGGAGGTAATGRAGAWPSQPPARSIPGELEPKRSDRGGGRGRRWRFWGQPGRRGRRIALILGTVVVVLIAGVAGTYFWLNGKLNKSV
ncbi:MAG: hypothetical protein ACRDOU_22565, partial [Streptosporangiaceae bacterium]